MPKPTPSSDPAAVPLGRRDRPLSPHLQVYRPQISSVLSILHRGTGIALCVGIVVVAWWLVAAACGVEAYAQFHDLAVSLPGRALLLGWAFALFYHTLAGIRHLCWDAGYGFSIPAFTRSGWAVVIGAVLLTALAGVVA